MKETSLFPQLSHELPLNLLSLDNKINDYSYCLPHLLDSNKEYRKHFLNLSAKGRYIIMDNSLHELGQAYDNDRLDYWVKALKPDEFIVPDVWLDREGTVNNAKEWVESPKREYEPLAVAVVQGSTKHEAILCFAQLVALGYKKIAISYGAPWYDEIMNSKIGNPNLRKAQGRMNFINTLIKMDLIPTNLKLHLLGCQVPQEFGWYLGIPQIETIDTSNPVMAALEGKTYDYYGLNYKPSINMNSEEIEINTPEQWAKTCLIIKHNVQKFREINGLKHRNIQLPPFPTKPKNRYSKSNYISVYDFLGKAAGMELGKEVNESALKSGVPIRSRIVNTPNYSGSVRLYPEEFLSNYFSPF